MMRVALISPPFESVPPRLYGGTERVVFNLCEGLTALGVEVVLFASGDSKVRVQLVPVIDQALRLRDVPVIDPNTYHVRMIASVAKQAGDFDLIHNHHDYWMLPLTQMVDTPVLTTLHGRMDHRDIQSVFLSYPNGHYVSISDSQRSLAPPLNWVRTVYNGLNLADFEFKEKSGQYLAFLGRISPEKRPDWAIDIAKAAGIPLKIAAKIEGRESQHYFDQRIKPHVDGRWVEYVGEISEREKSEFLGNALALVFPIDWPEPFGLVMIEALACGTPVLARPFGSVHEILENGVTGYAHSKVSVLAKLTKKIPALSRKGCRDWVEKRFSLQRMAEDYLHAYRHITRKRHDSHRHRRDFIYPVECPSQRNIEGQHQG